MRKHHTTHFSTQFYGSCVSATNTTTAQPSCTSASIRVYDSVMTVGKTQEMLGRNHKFEHEKYKEGVEVYRLLVEQ